MTVCQRPRLPTDADDMPTALSFRFNVEKGELAGLAHLAEVCPTDRIILIEDTRELQCTVENKYPMRVRSKSERAGKPARRSAQASCVRIIRRLL